jgi:hypothetical protein
MEFTGGNRSTRGKTCPSATLSTTNPTWTDPGSNLGLHGGRLATKCLSHGTTVINISAAPLNTTSSFRPWNLPQLSTAAARRIVIVPSLDAIPVECSTFSLSQIRHQARHWLCFCPPFNTVTVFDILWKENTAIISYDLLCLNSSLLEPGELNELHINLCWGESFVRLFT